MVDHDVDNVQTEIADVVFGRGQVLSHSRHDHVGHTGKVVSEERHQLQHALQSQHIHLAIRIRQPVHELVKDLKPRRNSLQNSNWALQFKVFWLYNVFINIGCSYD